MQMSVNFASHWASTAEASDVVVCAFVLDMSRADSEGVGILTRLFLSEKCSVVAGSPVLPPHCTPGKLLRCFSEKFARLTSCCAHRTQRNCPKIVYLEDNP